MKANNDNHLEKFVDKVMKETSLESPSPGFSSNLMMKVLAAGMNKATVYKPLISRRTWVIISGCMIALMVYLFNAVDVQAGSWFQYPDLTPEFDTVLKSLPVFKFSSITLYAVGLLTVMLFIQITLLKNYFNNRI